MKPGPKGRSTHHLALQEHAHNTKTRRSRPFPGSQCNTNESAMLGGLSLTSQYIINKIKLLIFIKPCDSFSCIEIFIRLCGSFFDLEIFIRLCTYLKGGWEVPYGSLNRKWPKIGLPLCHSHIELSLRLS